MIIFNSILDLPDILSNPFVTNQDYLPFESVNNVFPETEGKLQILQTPEISPSPQNIIIWAYD